MLAGFLIPVLTGCRDSAEEVSPEPSVPLRVDAQLAEILYSRGYETGPVTQGIYYLSYPNSANSGNYALGEVNFATEGVTPGIGIVTLPDNEELTWNSVEGNTPTFYLDNVPPALNTVNNSDPTTVVFGDENPFVAGLFDSENGSNDLLWGEKQENRNTKTVNFDLHHNMARLRVQVTVDETNAPAGELSLDGATVYITNLQLTPYSYNRLSGTLSFPEEPTYTDFYLVRRDQNLEWAQDTDSNPDLNPEPEPDSDSPITVYTTQDFVLPPQVLLQESTSRPRLWIKLANGTEFTGVIPYAMFVNDQEYENYPMTLSFLKEHILTISTLISAEPPTLTFMPVLLTEWVDKGNFDLDAHQAGIYTEQEFLNLIDYYKAIPAIRDYHLPRYGTYNPSTDTWAISLWSSLSLNYNEIAGQMIHVEDVNPNFSFNFHGYSVVVKYGTNQTYTANATTLYGILTGTIKLQ